MPREYRRGGTRDAHTVRCAGCVDPRPAGPAPAPRPAAEPTSGTAGASAQREFERRHAAREQRVLGRLPRIGKILLAVTSDPQTTTAWKTGADGERTLGRRLDGCAGASVIVLHDLRVPGKSSNIDHVVVTPSHVFVIDAKQYSGEVRARDDGGLFDRDVRLRVGGRDCSKLVRASVDQAAMVGRALTGLSPAPQVGARPLLRPGRLAAPGSPAQHRRRGRHVAEGPRIDQVGAHADGAAPHAIATARAIGQVFRPA